MNDTPSFTALDWFNIKDRGDCACVKLDRDTRDFAHLVGQSVLIDGELFTCLGVERRAHIAPWKAGEPIALLVEPIPAKGNASRS
jgi:hypothetical protein